MHVSGWNELRHRCLATILLPSNKTHTMHVHVSIMEENKRKKLSKNNNDFVYTLNIHVLLSF